MPSGPVNRTCTIPFYQSYATIYLGKVHQRLPFRHTLVAVFMPTSQHLSTRILLESCTASTISSSSSSGMGDWTHRRTADKSLTTSTKPERCNRIEHTSLPSSHTL